MSRTLRPKLPYALVNFNSWGGSAAAAGTVEGVPVFMMSLRGLGCSGFRTFCCLRFLRLIVML